MKRYVICILLILLVMPQYQAVAATEAEFMAEIQALTSFIERNYMPVNTQAPPPETLRSIIESGTDWLKQSLEPNGHFRYEYFPYEDRYADDDNIVRQAGTLFQLGELYQHDTDNRLELEETIERSIGYLESLAETDEYEGVSFRCVTNDADSNTCKLGSTSLALIAVLSYVVTNPDVEAEYEALIADFKAYILASKKPDEGFRSQHVVGRSWQSDKESSFFNGEALLALVRLYAYDPDPEIADLIEETFEYLKEQPFDSPLYLWIMAALKDAQTLLPNGAYVPYTEAFTTWRTEWAAVRRGTTRNYCAYTEGIASAYSILEGAVSSEELAALKNEIIYWTNKNVRLQVSTTDKIWYGLIDGTLVRSEAPQLAKSEGGFMTGLDEPSLRIDFTQHCLNGYLQLLVDIDGEAL